MNRRDVVEGMLLSAVIGTTALADGIAAPHEPRTGPQIIVFDTRFAAARKFGAARAERNTIAHGISGDVTPFWHNLLAVQWYRHAIAIHGMTTSPSFHCIEQLVADRFWRITSRVFEDGLVKWTAAPRSLTS